MEVSAALSPQCHLHIHCDPALLLLGLDVIAKSLPVPPAVLWQPWCSLFSRCHTMQLTPSSFVTMKTSCSSTHTVMDTRDTQNLSAQKVNCPQMPVDCCHVSLLKMKASKGMPVLRIRPDRVCWLPCKLLGGHHWSGGSGWCWGVAGRALHCSSCSNAPLPQCNTMGLALPCYPGWMEMSEVTLVSHYKALVWDSGNSGSTAGTCMEMSEVQDHSLHQAGVARSLCRRACIGSAWSNPFCFSWLSVSPSLVIQGPQLYPREGILRKACTRGQTGRSCR